MKTYEVMYACNKCDFVEECVHTFEESYEHCGTTCKSCNEGILEKMLNGGETAKIISGVTNYNAIPRALRDKLALIKKAHPGSQMNTF